MYQLTYSTPDRPSRKVLIPNAGNTLREAVDARELFRKQIEDGTIQIFIEKRRA